MKIFKLNSDRRFSLKLFCVLIIVFVCSGAGAQNNKMTLSLYDVIRIAGDQSTQALIAKHTFRANYWRYRTHVAKFLPSLSLDATVPDLNRSISVVTQSDGTEEFVSQKQMTSFANLSLNQNIGPTGGSIFVTTNLERIDLFNSNTTTSYMSTPFSIGFRQPILAFNSYKWEDKVEPLIYREAMKNYQESREQISISAIGYFFDLALAQINLNIAMSNLSNSDTLYKISKGRYNVGTIAENELLQMELSYMNSQSALKQAELDLEVKKFSLRSFLGYNESVDIELQIPYKVPDVQIDVDKATAEALENNASIITYERQLIEAARDVAQAESESRLNVNLYASYGLTQTSGSLTGAYQRPDGQQKASIGITLPILDWGLGRGKVKMAKSSQEVINSQVSQNKIDFERDVFLKVMQFNMQGDQVRIAAKADTIAQNRYEVSKQRFMVGKIDALELNNALSDKDVNKRNYISALRSFWSFYYTIRKITLYDFNENTSLKEDFEKITD